MTAEPETAKAGMLKPESVRRLVEHWRSISEVAANITPSEIKEWGDKLADALESGQPDQSARIEDLEKALKTAQLHFREAALDHDCAICQRFADDIAALLNSDQGGGR